MHRHIQAHTHACALGRKSNNSNFSVGLSKKYAREMMMLPQPKAVCDRVCLCGRVCVELGVFRCVCVHMCVCHNVPNAALLTHTTHCVTTFDHAIHDTHSV